MGIFAIRSEGNNVPQDNVPQDNLTVKFNRNAANTQVYFAATGDVIINGVIDVSATATDVFLPPVPENPKQTAGTGGFNCGFGGTGTSPVGGPFCVRGVSCERRKARIFKY